MANFETIRWNFSSSTNPEIGGSERAPYFLTSCCLVKQLLCYPAGYPAVLQQNMQFCNDFLYYNFFDWNIRKTSKFGRWWAKISASLGPVKKYVRKLISSVWRKTSPTKLIVRNCKNVFCAKTKKCKKSSNWWYFSR